MEDFAPLFERIGPPLEDYADDHNLTIERYYHDAPVWGVCFAHPKGGSAKIDITHTAGSSFKIQGTWWVDDYDSFTRSLKRIDDVLFDESSGEIIPLIDRLVREILALEPSDWSDVDASFKGVWDKVWTKEEFTKTMAMWDLPDFD